MDVEVRVLCAVVLLLASSSSDPLVLAPYRVRAPSTERAAEAEQKEQKKQQEEEPAATAWRHAHADPPRGIIEIELTQDQEALLFVAGTTLAGAVGVPLAVWTGDVLVRLLWLYGAVGIASVTLPFLFVAQPGLFGLGVFIVVFVGAIAPLLATYDATQDLLRYPPLVAGAAAAGGVIGFVAAAYDVQQRRALATSE